MELNVKNFYQQGTFLIGMGNIIIVAICFSSATAISSSSGNFSRRETVLSSDRLT